MNKQLIAQLLRHANCLERQYDPMVGAFDSTIELLRKAAVELDTTDKMKQCENKMQVIEVPSTYPPYHEDKFFVELSVVRGIFGDG